MKALSPPEGLVNIGVIIAPGTKPRSNNLL